MCAAIQASNLLEATSTPTLNGGNGGLSLNNFVASFLKHEESDPTVNCCLCIFVRGVRRGFKQRGSYQRGLIINKKSALKQAIAVLSKICFAFTGF